LDAVAIYLLIFPNLFQRVTNPKKLSFGFSESHISSVFIAVCSFLTPPLLPNKNQPLAQLYPYSSASAQHLTWTVFSQVTQLFYFKKEVLFVLS